MSSPTDYNPQAHSRNPIETMIQGRATSLFQASVVGAGFANSGTGDFRGCGLTLINLWEVPY
jgi:hypothetical protein